MASNLPIIRPQGLMMSRLDRRVDQALAHMEAREVVVRQADALRIERAAQKVHRAQLAVAAISSMEAALCQTVPEAQHRLRAVGDIGTINIAQILAEGS
jgi:hypothetical protein